VPGRGAAQALLPVVSRSARCPGRSWSKAAGRSFTERRAPTTTSARAMHRRDGCGCPNDPALMIFAAEFLRVPAAGIARARFPEGRERRVAARPRGRDGVDRGARAAVTRWKKAASRAPTRLGAAATRTTARRRTRGATAPTWGPAHRPAFYASGASRHHSAPGRPESPTFHKARLLTKAGAPVPGRYRGRARAAFWTGDAYPAQARPCIGMTMPTYAAAPRGYRDLSDRSRSCGFLSSSLTGPCSATDGALCAMARLFHAVSTGSVTRTLLPRDAVRCAASPRSRGRTDIWRTSARYSLCQRAPEGEPVGLGTTRLTAARFRRGRDVALWAAWLKAGADLRLGRARRP